MDIAIHPTVLAIYIHIDGRINHGMIERGVKHSFLVVCAVTINDR